MAPIAKNRRAARRAPRVALAAFALAAALHGARAWAEPTPAELDLARKTFNEGKALETKNRWGEALERFKKVAGVKMTPQVRFHIALCEEHLGKLVSAMKGFELAAEEARRAGSMAAEVAEKAPPRAAALQKRVGALRVELTGKLITSTLTLDGAPLARDELGGEIPVDPGKHVVELRDDTGKSTLREEVKVAEGGRASVRIEAHDTGAPRASAASKPVPPAPPSRTPVYITAATGLVFLAGAGVFYGLREASFNEVISACKSGGDGNYTDCPRELMGTAEAGRVYTTLSGVSLGIGAASLVASGVLWFSLRSRVKDTASRAAFSLSVAPMGTGFAARGAF